MVNAPPVANALPVVDAPRHGPPPQRSALENAALRWFETERVKIDTARYEPDAAQDESTHVHIQLHVEEREAAPTLSDEPALLLPPDYQPHQSHTQTEAAPASTAPPPREHPFAPVEASPAAPPLPAAAPRLAAAPPIRKLSRQQSMIIDAFDIDGDGVFQFFEICSRRAIRRLKWPFLRACATLRYADHYWRFLLPLTYGPYVIITLSRVNWGNDWMALYQASPATSGC